MLCYFCCPVSLQISTHMLCVPCATYGKSLKTTFSNTVRLLMSSNIWIYQLASDNFFELVNIQQLMALGEIHIPTCSNHLLACAIMLPIFLQYLSLSPPSQNSEM